MKHYLRFLITMLLLAIWGGISYGQGQETVVKTLSFPPDNKEDSENQSYVDTKTYTIGSDSWSVTGFNNNHWNWTENGHTIIRCGKNDDKSVASIATSKAYSEPITKVVVSLETYNKSYLTDAVLTVSSNENFSSDDIQTVRLTPAQLNKGDVAFVIPNPTKDSFYKLTFNCKSSGGKNGQTAHVSKVQYFAVETKTGTNVTFGVDVDGKTFDVTEGKESAFSEKTATEKDGVAGTINYSSNNTDVVSVDETTGAVTFGKTFGTATITALFTPADAATYRESSASYTINYNEKERIPTTLSFADPSGSVNIGETFTLPELTLKAGNEVLTGRTFKYSSSATDVASIDEKGAVTILSAGNTVLTAKFDADDKYESSSATFALKVIDPNTIVFSAADGSFDGLGTGYAATEKEQTYQFVSASKEKYDFKVKQCVRGTNSTSIGFLQVRDNQGVVKSPTFDGFTNGYKVTVYYSKAQSSKVMTITSEQLLDAKSTTAQTTDGEECVTTISLPLSTATFTMTANKGNKYVSRIELTPLAAPEVETVTLDETTNNDDVVIKNEGKTVNVTLKRTISDTYLNPFCVPFDMTADQITEVFGEGSVVSAFTSVTGKVMNFERVATIAAGQPYIVQATKASTEISLDKVEMKFEPGSNVKQNSDELSMSFNGIVSPYTFKKNDGTELFLDKNGNLRYPSTVGSQMKGMRAYFEVLDGIGNEAKVNIGGGLSSIDKLMNGEAMTGKVYNLNGQYVGNTLDGLAKGLYIMNGKKYVVK